MQLVMKALSCGVILLGTAVFVLPVNALKLEYKASAPDWLQIATAPRMPEESKLVPDDKCSDSQSASVLAHINGK